MKTGIVNKTYGVRITRCSIMCMVLILATATEAGATTWNKVAAEGQSFSLESKQTVRYGAGTEWVTKTLSGLVSCSKETFGDFLDGTKKRCELKDVSAQPKVTLTATPTTINRGGSTTLTWSAYNATSCFASGSWHGKKALSDSVLKTTIYHNKTFYLTCKGLGGADTVSVALTVLPKGRLPTVTLSADPSIVHHHGTTTLTWSSTNATVCDAPGGSTDTSGSYTTEELTKSQEYSVVCTGPHGSASESVFVTVLPHDDDDHDGDVDDRLKGPFNMPPGTWKKIANHRDTYKLDGIQIVRFGGDTRWIVRQDYGTTKCQATWDNSGITSDFTYTDPIPNKQCDVFVPDVESKPIVIQTGGPDIDIAKIPPGVPGSGTIDIGESGESPAPSDIGAFRTSCRYSHMSFDDPIVYPGQPGKAHLHTFFGNSDLNAYSTAESIATKGKSTCAGGIANRSGYWAPAMIDTRSGTPIAPGGVAENVIFYYKTGYRGVNPQDVVAAPPGLRMIAGAVHGARPDQNRSPYEDLHFFYSCTNGGEELGHSATVINCPLGSTLLMSVMFPQCWDGVNLDSPNHRDHMAYPDGGCPKSHPIAIPEVTINVEYPVKEKDAPLHWRLSSDHYDTSLEAGFSLHADWFNGWEKNTMDTFVKYCDQASMDCHGYLLGDGHILEEKSTR